MTDKKQPQFVCAKHPDRVAAVECKGVLKCWECYLPPDDFQKRFGPDFYKKDLK